MDYRMENPPTRRRWVTTNQDEFQNPACVRINRNVDSLEFARYEACMDRQAACEEELQATVRQTLCADEQEQNREPIHYPTDSHIDEGVKMKPSWCRCMATGNPNCYEEQREEKANDDLCYCKQIHNQMDPTSDNERQKVYSSTYFIDYREPDYNYIASTKLNKGKFDKMFWDYKNKVDAEDAKKDPKIVPPEPAPENPVDPNCLGLYDSLPPEKREGVRKPDESWWRDESPECVKDLVKKFIWTSTYREMNKDGAALPVTVRETPATSLEKPPGDRLRRKPEMAPCTMYDLGEVSQNWDRPQIRHVARRCDTMYNRPCLDYDPYFKDHRLHRAKFARCTDLHHQPPSAENMELVKAERMRLPYDKMIPGYTGFPHAFMIEAPPVCKVKKSLDFSDPDDSISTYQFDYVRFPKEIYESGGQSQSFNSLDFTKNGITGHPICALSRISLPAVSRLSCYLECNKNHYPTSKKTCG